MASTKVEQVWTAFDEPPIPTYSEAKWSVKVTQKNKQARQQAGRVHRRELRREKAQEDDLLFEEIQQLSETPVGANSERPLSESESSNLVCVSHLLYVPLA